MVPEVQRASHAADWRACRLNTASWTTNRLAQKATAPISTSRVTAPGWSSRRPAVSGSSPHSTQASPMKKQCT
jgi:hypothetical protein